MIKNMEMEMERNFFTHERRRLFYRCLLQYSFNCHLFAKTFFIHSSESPIFFISFNFHENAFEDMTINHKYAHCFNIFYDQCSVLGKSAAINSMIRLIWNWWFRFHTLAPTTQVGEKWNPTSPKCRLVRLCVIVTFLSKTIFTLSSESPIFLYQSNLWEIFKKIWQ